ncbi:MAG: NYN domain-containing protein [Gemmatimonadetes bacterium]|nr:NYN domain-containing protein [Gemmatimonadota bacterium]MBK8057389.1 NYN domain-containing protein [Gemmatimonadota bacterium]
MSDETTPGLRRPRTIVYVDGFNLYYGALKRSDCKWLDLTAFARRLLPKNDVVAVKYFTARIAARPNDMEGPARQDTYLRALATLPEVRVYLGHFLSSVVRLPLANDDGTVRLAAGRPQMALVRKEEEKGSDVHLATQLVRDAHLREFEVAVVVTNDSDLAPPIELVTNELGLVVGVANPHAENPKSRQSRRLLRAARFMKPVRRGALRGCQLPPTIRDARGEFSRPASWG